LKVGNGLWLSFTGVAHSLCSPDLFVMNKAMLYIRDNEQTSHVAMVHVHKNHEDEVVMNAFKQNVVLLNRMYPKYVIDMIGVSWLLLNCCDFLVHVAERCRFAVNSARR
jgi:hypothetical protein